MHRYTIELRLTGPTLDPAHITAQLGLTPTTQWKIGETANPKHRDKALWAYAPAGECRPWPDFESMTSALLDELRPVQQKLAELRAEHEAFFWCGHFDSSFDGGPSFSPELLRALAEFAIPLYIDTHFVRDDPPGIGCTP